MNTSPEVVTQILQSLAATSTRLDTLSQTYDVVQLHAKPDSETWSANEILAHLRACADVWGKSILGMIEQDHPTLRYVSPRTWMKKTNYASLDFRGSLKAFQQQREALLAALKRLKLQDWQRGATFTATTRGREQTVLSYAERIAAHEQEHCAEMEERLSSLRQ